MSHVGEMVRQWRTHRRMSQLDLARDAEVSTRHLSCVETGKARPSREMLLVLASALDLPLRERNTLLQSGGFAPAYPHTDLDAPELAAVRIALDHLLNGAEPYGAIAFDRLGRTIRANRPMRGMLRTLLGEAPAPGFNLLRAMFDEPLRSALVNFDEVACEVAGRLRREAIATHDPELEAMTAELEARGVAATDGTALVIPVVIAVGDQTLRFFTTITTLGTPVDVTLSELRIETYFPADEATEAALRALAPTLIALGA